MFLCNVCGVVFEQAKVRGGVGLEHFGHPCREEFDVCPSCGSDNIDRAAPCTICGAYTKELCMEEGFCPACAMCVVKRFTAFVDTLTQEEKDLLNERYYGVDAFL